MAIFTLPYDQTIVKPIVDDGNITVFERKQDVNVVTELKRILSRLDPKKISEARSNKKSGTSVYEITALNNVIKELKTVENIHTYIVADRPLTEAIQDAKGKKNIVKFLKDLLRSLGMPYE